MLQQGDVGQNYTNIYKDKYFLKEMSVWAESGSSRCYICACVCVGKWRYQGGRNTNYTNSNY